MAVRTSEAEWKGDLRGGEGMMKFGGGAFQGRYSYSSRFEEGPGTNPEELIAAAHAGCFSMAFAAQLSEAGFTPARVQTTAKVHLGKVADAFAITRIDLFTEAEVPNIPEGRFREIAEAAKAGCPVSKALASVPITLDAKLV
ncbi:MAG TPA: OsmC family protein [Armatimonadota bacterium]|jgi:osmotically inducible protein OsmC|nr:OsmC family protein [Armatimonadota bacterium]HOJ22117.1 OsmC family protein [Armatimonadota bacterium]HOM83814.1 OsmC family protein [Armatimonadota bacterium]HOQ28036.1 OsmC family protein [Armatimonadota bacterium]HPO73097.1 OsmC family protein [Armatimonadota bacterium]